MALTSLLYLLLGAVLGKQFCLFLILPSCLVNLLLHFGSFKVRSWSKGPPSACTCATQWETRPAQIMSPFSAGSEGSFSSDLSEEDRDDDEELYVPWVCRALAASLPLGTLITPRVLHRAWELLALCSLFLAKACPSAGYC